MVGFFCALALLQHFTGIFPGEQKDFMGRLVWPFIDFVTLKSSSANWVAFFITPAHIISFIILCNTIIHRKKLRGDRAALLEFCFTAAIFFLADITVYLTQSYGAYAAIFAAITLYLFRALRFKEFLAVFLVLCVMAGGIFLLQKDTWKFKVFSGESSYRFDTSVTSRADIYRMNVHMILTNPLLGVGLNQYQSYFKEYQKEVLGHDLNESHTPPHAHNFFTSFWTSLGFFGFLAVVILMIGIFWHTKFSPGYPAAFVFLAIMIHGLIDAYYWKQEIAYTFWIVVGLCYLYRLPGKVKKVE
ncbi:MAG TPA: O-antigen ligase family protein [Candidatus Gracilibacteria bacterium]|nr:O-antigen ligase family protein [Candidatus Gracilibacteria bacterium]